MLYTAKAKKRERAVGRVSYCVNGAIRSGRVSYGPFYMRSGYRNNGALSYANSTLGFRSEWCTQRWICW